jgi:outer membrane receptor protein involved in Fe transport
MKSRSSLLGLLLLAVLAAVAPVAAQTTGTVRGTVQGAGGQPIAGATVTLAGDAILGGSRATTTGPTGAYIFTSVPVGVYSVTVEAEGVQAQTIDGVRVSLNATVALDVDMTAAFSEEVVVSGAAPVLDTTSSAVGVNYNSDFIENLPTRRNFYDLIAVSPGVSQSSEGSDRQIAFGSNMQSNAWHVDGLDTSAPETGSAWWAINPDTIEEVQVLGVGAPAEFGNMLGAAFNVVTKSGSNELKGGLNVYYQNDSLTDSALDIEDTEFPEFEREKYHDITGTLGGPIVRDKWWFFLAGETLRDGYTGPRADPAFTPINFADRYDVKITGAIGDKNLIDVKGHYEDWGYPDPASPFVTPDALSGEKGENPAWGITYQRVLSAKNTLDLKYAGWWADDVHDSQTGSTATPFVDYSPPGGGPPLYSGSPTFPWEYETWRNQFDAKLTHFAEDFIKGDHDFRFGVQFNTGSAETSVAPGPDGYYIYRYEYYPGYPYFYRYEHQPYIYGGEQDGISAFADDTWRINGKLTLNLGVRYDKSDASIPDYDELGFDGLPTGAKIPGIDPLLDWETVSPRIGFAYTPRADGRMVVRGSFGVYYDGNVSGNWDYPPPNLKPGRTYLVDPETFEIIDLVAEFATSPTGVDPDLDPPRTLQYAIGFERQFGQNFTLGVEAIYKDTSDLVGWEILGDGVYEPFEFVDPFTGNTFTLLNQIEQATVRKGNRPGFTAEGFLDEYYQDYRGATLTLKRRYADGWSLMASYTWSESEGLIPRMLSQSQFNPFYGSREGADPNNYINADQLLQADREHMLRLQTNFDLPWKLYFGASANFQSGAPYSRQIRVPLDQGLTTVIMEPASDDRRKPFQSLLDLSIGRRFPVGGNTFKLDLQVLNALNEDANEFFETLVLQEGDTLLPSDWIFPRRLVVRVGWEF